jgi:ribonuclease PH
VALTGAVVAMRLACRYLVEEGVIAADPVIAQVAAVSCGYAGGAALLDLDYPEDSSAEVDANFVLASDGRLIEVQATGEKRAFTRDEFAALLDLAEAGCGQLFEAQRAALG